MFNDVSKKTHLGVNCNSHRFLLNAFQRCVSHLNKAWGAIKPHARVLMLVALLLLSTGGANAVVQPRPAVQGYGYSPSPVNMQN